MRDITTIPLPPASTLIIDYEVSMAGEWLPWSNKVPQIEVETHKVASPDVVVPTLDTGKNFCVLLILHDYLFSTPSFLMSSMGIAIGTM